MYKNVFTILSARPWQEAGSQSVMQEALWRRRGQWGLRQGAQRRRQGQWGRRPGPGLGHDAGSRAKASRGRAQEPGPAPDTARSNGPWEVRRRKEGKKIMKCTLYLLFIKEQWAAVKPPGSNLGCLTQGHFDMQLWERRSNRILCGCGTTPHHHPITFLSRAMAACRLTESHSPPTPPFLDSEPCLLPTIHTLCHHINWMGCNSVMLPSVHMASIASVHPGRGIILCCSSEGFFPFFPCESFFSISWELLLIRCEVLGQDVICVQIVMLTKANS